jgi:hypothetical protein
MEPSVDVLISLALRHSFNFSSKYCISSLPILNGKTRRRHTLSRQSLGALYTYTPQQYLVQGMTLLRDRVHCYFRSTVACRVSTAKNLLLQH